MINPLLLRFYKDFIKNGSSDGTDYEKSVSSAFSLGAPGYISHSPDISIGWL